MSVTFKFILKKQNGGEPEIRRLPIASPDLITLDFVRTHARKLFKLPDDMVWYFKWQDEEGDLVTITEDYELEDVVQANSFDQGTVRLNIFVDQPEPKQPPQQAFFPVHMMAFPPVASHPHFFCKKNKRDARAKVPSPHQDSFSALCDVTNTRLSMGEGNWFHQPGTTTDICVDEFSNLSEADQQKFVHVTKPSDLGDEQVRYQGEPKSFKCRKGRCHKNDRFGESFGRPPWCHGANQQQQRQQQNQAEIPLFDSQFEIGDLHQLTHVGCCNVTGSLLVSGQGWYHKRNTTYDLCEKYFNKLDSSEKEQFVRVDKPEDLGDDQQRYDVMSKVGSVLDQVMKDLSSVSGDAAGQDAAAHSQDEPVPSPAEASTKCDGDACGLSLNPASASSPSASSCSPAPAVSATTAEKNMKIVSGPSIPDETEVETGSHVIGVWEVENTGSGLWVDVRVKPQTNTDVNENVLQVNSDGFEVAVLDAGQRGLVSVDLMVRDGVVMETSGKTVEAVFELVDGDGNVFGEPLKLKLHVMPKKETFALPPVANEKEFVVRLGEMGFSDQAVCTRVLRELKGDVNATALALLRAQFQ